jgi:tetratricopeptide (TPR) repeat protein
VQTLLQLARLYEKLGKPSDALKIYKRILDLSPENEEAEEAYLRLRMENL